MYFYFNFSLKNIDDLKIPKFGLLESDVASNLHFQYSIFLFNSIYSYPSKCAVWFLKRKNAFGRIMQMEEDFQVHCFETINNVLSYSKFDINGCVQWAFSLCKLIFHDNVVAANKEIKKLNSEICNKLKPNLRYPLYIEASTQAREFVIVAALLMAKMINIAPDEKTEKEIRRIVCYQNHDDIQPFLEFPVMYKSVQKFTDLRNFKANLFSGNNIIKANNLATVQIVPLDCVPENSMIEKFLAHAKILRTYNFTRTESSYEPSASYLRKIPKEFKKSIYFRFYSRFVRFI